MTNVYMYTVLIYVNNTKKAIIYILYKYDCIFFYQTLVKFKENHLL